MVKIFRWSLVVFGIICTVLVSLAVYIRFFFPPASHYKSVIELRLSRYMQAQVQIGELSSHWRGLKPIIIVKAVHVQNTQGRSLMNIREVDIGVDVLASLWNWKLEPGDLTVIGTDLILKEKPNGLVSINDIPGLVADLKTESSEKLKTIGEWFITKGAKEIRDVNLTWSRQDGASLPFRHIRVQGHGYFLNHDFQGQAFLPSQRVLKFEGKAYGCLYAENWIKFHLNYQIDKLPLDVIFTQFISDRNRIHGGEADIKGKFKWHSKKEFSLINHIQATQVTLNNPHNKTHIINSLRGDIAWHKQAFKWSLLFENLNLQLDGKVLPLHRGRYLSDQRLNSQHLQINTLPLYEIKELLLEEQVLPENMSNLLFSLDPTGEILNFNVHHIGKEFNFKSFSDIKASGHLNGVNFSAILKYPGIKNLSGYFSISSQKGQLFLDSKNLIFNYQSLFRNDIPIEILKGNISWKKSNQNWLIKMDKSNLRTHDGKASGWIRVLVPTSSSPTLITNLNFELFSAKHANLYYPAKIMSKSLVSWLDNAIQEAQLTSGNFIFNGQLADFPFDNKPGKFLITAKMHHGILHYLPYWPDIEDMRGELIFRNRAMLVHLEQASMLGARVGPTNAIIKDLEHAKLNIDGRIQSGKDQTIKFNKEPLQKILKQSLGDIVVNGGIKLALKLFIPIDNDKKAKFKMSGLLKSNSSDVTISGLALNLQKLTGNITFSENTIQSPLLTADLFNSPVQVQIKTEWEKGNPISKINFNGRFKAEELQRKFDLPLLKKITGETDYSGLLQFSNINGIFKTSLQMNTDLNGIEINLPAPISKSKVTNIPTHFDAFYSPNSSLKMTVKYGNELNGIFDFTKKAENFVFNRGTISFGSSSANLQYESGLSLTGHLKEFNWADWQPLFFDKATHKSDSATFKNVFLNINLDFDDLTVSRFKLSQTNIQAKKTHEELAIKIKSPIMQGDIFIPANTKNAIRARLSRLILKEETTNDDTLNPNDIPALDLAIDNFQYKTKEIKHLVIKTNPTEKGLAITQLSINEPFYNLKASGLWEVGSANKMHTALHGELDSKNIGAVLNQWKLTDNVVLGNGSIKFDTNWNGTPQSPELKSLQGQVSLNFKHGRIVHLSQQASMGLGLGKVLNLLSLQSIPRRLILDFSDLTTTGFSFDNLQGTFKLREGNAYTEGAVIEGTEAKIRVNGRIGLGNKDYNLSLVITPNVTSSLPLVATITAGPIAGAITWVADKIFSRQVKKITEIHYNVTGSWNKPNMVKLS